ncbi:protein of unknown function [Azospirillum baldaniorum]|uniref:Uncharacterized protein n=1 Tax=Azospirillum baldaniorum TaxID=1064539 RepID=A0A9P1NLI6_9PROT|nr:protein of unknown function [Azospirillum baldaniorum]
MIPARRLEPFLPGWGVRSLRIGAFDHRCARRACFRDKPFALRTVESFGNSRSKGKPFCISVAAAHNDLWLRQNGATLEKTGISTVKQLITDWSVIFSPPWRTACRRMIPPFRAGAAARRRAPGRSSTRP